MKQQSAGKHVNSIHYPDSETTSLYLNCSYSLLFNAACLAEKQQIS